MIVNFPRLRDGLIAARERCALRRIPVTPCLLRRRATRSPHHSSRITRIPLRPMVACAKSDAEKKRHERAAYDSRMQDGPVEKCAHVRAGRVRVCALGAHTVRTCAQVRTHIL